jgi:GDPmannose 4,6-dehydratase
MPKNSQRITNNRARSALILGITGQDGSYLTEHLLAEGYEVHGVVRRASLFNRGRIEHLRAMTAKKRLALHYSDLTDHTSLRRIIQKVRPREIYHLAGQSHVGLSFEIPEVTCQENANATLGLLEILRDLDYPVKIYNAASSEIFGAPLQPRQNERTAFNPVNPYGCAKAFAAHICRVYREAYGLFAVNGIAYNHESPRRGENFVTRKISLGAARIRAGQLAEISLGNLDAKRDWGWSPEFVVGMWRSLQVKEARDYVLATGRPCSVREFATAAFGALGIKLKFSGRGAAEVARRTDTGAVVLRIDPRFYRPLEPTTLVGDPRLARQVLGWRAKVAGKAVARLMAQADYAALQGGR